MFQYFAAAQVTLPETVPWVAPAAKRASALHAAIKGLDDAVTAKIMNDADRIGAMADEAGEAALFAVTPKRDIFNGLPNGYSRATWSYLNASDAFNHAEEVRYADDRRYGRMWDGYVCSRGCLVARDGEALSNFKSFVADYFDSRNVFVEICDRSRPNLEGKEQSLVQATVYREGRVGERKAFVNGQIDRFPNKPVLELSITYEAANGVIEVVADTRETRAAMARAFADHLLNTPFSGHRLPIKKYSLNHMCKYHEFITDINDNIENVSVNLLRLMPYDSQGERVTLECMRGAKHTIWHMADMRFGRHNPLLGGYGVTQMRFTIAFRAIPGAHGRRKLPVTITMPQGCNLKDRTERERLIGEKYLRRWGLIEDV